jgi:hypothetical protein
MLLINHLPRPSKSCEVGVLRSMPEMISFTIKVEVYHKTKSHIYYKNWIYPTKFSAIRIVNTRLTSRFERKIERRTHLA